MLRIGKTQKRILLLLVGGVGLGLSANPRQYYKMLAAMRDGWSEIDYAELQRSSRRLVAHELLRERQGSDGSFRLELTQLGKREAKRLSFVGQGVNFNKQKKWDKKWRIVIFDIPEKKRGFRDILRQHLRDAGFIKMQHSVFISPHPFERQIEQLAELYAASNHVRVITATRIDNEAKWKEQFFR